jgi:hypothetical protein
LRFFLVLRNGSALAALGVTGAARVGYIVLIRLVMFIPITIVGLPPLHRHGGPAVATQPRTAPEDVARGEPGGRAA